MTRIAFVIIATQAQPWAAIHTDGQVPTWLAGLSATETYFCAYSSGSAGESWISKTDHRKIEYARNANKSFLIKQPKLQNAHHGVFEAVNGYGSLITCTLSAMSHLIQTFQPDYIVRTNVSSYWNLARLRSLLRTAPATNYYAGLPHRLYGGLYGRLNRAGYAAGAGFVISADVAAQFVKYYNKFSTTFIDDMAFGLQARRLRLALTPSTGWIWKAIPLPKSARWRNLPRTTTCAARATSARMITGNAMMPRLCIPFTPE